MEGYATGFSGGQNLVWHEVYWAERGQSGQEAKKIFMKEKETSRGLPLD